MVNETTIDVLNFIPHKMIFLTLQFYQDSYNHKKSVYFKLKIIRKTSKKMTWLGQSGVGF
jgi:hypothetical protein